MKSILVMILILLSSITYSQNKSRQLEKKIPKAVQKELDKYANNYFETSISIGMTYAKPFFRDIANNKYLAGAHYSYKMVGIKTFQNCDRVSKNCVTVKEEVINYPLFKDKFSKQFKTIALDHFNPYYLDSKKEFIEASIKENRKKLIGVAQYGTFAKLKHKKYSKLEKYESSFSKLKRNGQIFHIVKEKSYKKRHISKKKNKNSDNFYAVFVLIKVQFVAHTHTRPVKEKLKKVRVKFSDKHKATSGKILYERLGPGFKQDDFEQTVKLKKNVANNPKEKFTTGHYKVSLKDAFCGCDYPLEDNKILDTYDKEMKEQYKHNFELDLVKGDITGGIKSNLSNKSFLKDKAVQLIPACKDGGLEKSRVSLTNNDGKFTFPSMPKGVYKIKVGNTIVGEAKHCRAKAKLTYVGKYNYNDNLYSLDLVHKIYSKNKYVGRLEMKLKDIDLQAYPFCEEKYKEVVNVYPPSKKDIQDVIDEYKEDKRKERKDREVEEKAEQAEKKKKEEKRKSKDTEDKSLEDSMMDSFEDDEGEGEEDREATKETETDDCVGNCKSEMNDVVNDYKKSFKKPPYLDKSFKGLNYTYLTKVIAKIPNVKYFDLSKMKKHSKCRVSSVDRKFSIKGTLKALKVAVVGGTLSKNSVYLDYKFNIECLIGKSKFWVPKWIVTAMPTPKKYSKLYRFSKLDDESIKNIWQRKAFEFKSPTYKVGNISQNLVLKGNIQGAKCTDYFSKSECANAYQTKDNPKTETVSQESSPFDCLEKENDACGPGLEDTFECDEQRSREEKEKKDKEGKKDNNKEKNDEPTLGEGMGEGKSEGKDSSSDGSSDNPEDFKAPDDW